MFQIVTLEIGIVTEIRTVTRDEMLIRIAGDHECTAEEAAEYLDTWISNGPTYFKLDCDYGIFNPNEPSAPELIYVHTGMHPVTKVRTATHLTKTEAENLYMDWYTKGDFSLIPVGTVILSSKRFGQWYEELVILRKG